MDLFGLPSSPWTEKARWALDHHGLRYRFREHVPVIGEAALRFHAKQLRGRVTVPLLVTRHGPVRASLAIAEFADRVGREATLFPAEHRASIARWDDEGERGLEAIRLLVTRALERSAAARAESTPPIGPMALRAAAGGLGLALFGIKYGIPRGAAGADAEAQAALAIASLLEGLRQALAGQDHLLGDFTYADVTMGAVLQGVSPVAHPSYPIGRATREAWTRGELASRFADLLEWRDRLYAEHRKARAP